MIRTTLIFSFLALVACLSGCYSSKPIPVDADQAFQNATEFELFSLDPFPSERIDRKKNFRRWSVLGSTSVKNQETREKLITDFKAGIAEHRGRAAACFNPRHGVRVVHEGSTHEFVICFECFQVRWYIDGVETRGFLISDCAGIHV